MDKLTLSLTDKLAIDRTKLANERTFLAYFRTFIVFLSSGFAIIKLDVLVEIRWIGYMLTIIGPILFLIGLLRFFYVKRNISKYYTS
ncbi:MAG: DUF202 domain-containing protein [bacterium]